LHFEHILKNHLLALQLVRHDLYLVFWTSTPTLRLGYLFMSVCLYPKLRYLRSIEAITMLYLRLGLKFSGVATAERSWLVARHIFES